MIPSTYLVNQKLPSDSFGIYQASDDGGTRDGMMFIPPMNELQHISGLSLSLGSQQLHLNQYSNTGLSSFLEHSQSTDVKEDMGYLSFDSVKPSVERFENDIVMNLGSEYSSLFCNSKYMKAAQELLDELASVFHGDFKTKLKEGSSDFDVNPDMESGNPLLDSINNSSPFDLQNNLAKLSSMLGEVDRHYKLYCHQMQGLVSSFDIIAGRGAAFPYTGLAVRTISRRFRCLRDAIKKQIEAIQKSLGDQDDNNGVSSGGLSRLRYVDQEIRQQKGIQQFGSMKQPWRPQRGLPETAVSVLRAWLFEHFLHPYPKDSEKLVLARQTGLSRSQVTNWFINARVRLWKPMIEDMYKEEFGDENKQPKSPQDNNTTGHQEMSSFYDISSEDNVSFNNIEDNVSMMNSKRENNSFVSLALGLQKSEKDSSSSSMPDGIIQLNDASSSSPVEKLDYYYMDPVNNRSRYNDVHLLSDYVA